MESNIITVLFLPISLSIIMLGMGLSLTIGDFKRIIEIPKPIIAGLFTQLIMLPIIAFSLVHFWTLKPEFAVGIILLAACPGGATSNLFAYLAKCDAALSISLTAISSLITIFTIPFIVNLGLKIHMGTSNEIALPVIETMLKIMLITVIPVLLGMYLKRVKPALALQAERPVKIASGIIITVFIFGAIFKDRENVIPYFLQTGGPAFTLNMLTLFLGFWVGRLAKLSYRQSATISIEGGIQNGTLAIAIASSTTMLNNSEIAIPAAIYSLIMFLTGGIIAFYFQKKNNADIKEYGTL